MSTAIELDLRPTVAAELFPALHQAYLKLKPGTRLRGEGKGDANLFLVEKE